MPLTPYYNATKQSRYNETKRSHYNKTERPYYNETKRKTDCFKISKKVQYVTAILLLNLSGLAIDYHFPGIARMLSLEYGVLDNGDGTCQWHGAKKLDPNSKPHGTLFASYPGSGMRLVWQMTEGATGIQVGDDFFYSGKTINGIVKTQYPHPEGIWSYGTAMNQTVLLVRNPRWNIPSYHSTLYELEYAHDYKIAYDNVFTLFSRRAPMSNWVQWRDYRFEDEIDLWAWQIDFYMEGGSKFWQELDFERAGQYPFHYYDDTEKPWPKDAHCKYDISDGCEPKAVVSYERMKDPATGPGELRKITDQLRFKRDMTVLSDEIMDCVWNETWKDAPEKRNDNRDAGGNDGEFPSASSDYMFTVHQMQTILAKVIIMKNKYSKNSADTGGKDWVLHPVARDLVKILHSYINEISAELGALYSDPSPTPAPQADLIAYKQAQVAWYNEIGKGNKYAKDIVQHMSAYWSKVKDLYNGTEPAALGCDSNYTTENLTPTEKEWLEEHNTRRTTFYDMHELGPKDLEWSMDLAESAQNYAEILANQSGCFLESRLNNDQYGTQNLGLNRGNISAAPSDVLEAWHDNEIILSNMTLVGKKFHASMLLFRSSHYVGCGQASKEDERNPGDMCHFHVCRYTGPGNCFLEAFIDVYPNFKKLMTDNCMEKNPGNYWVCSAISDHASTICQELPHLPMYPKDKCE